MMFLKALAFIPITLSINILVYLFSPVLAAISMVTGPKLPGILALTHTHDDDLDGGQHQLGWPKEKGFKLWKQRMAWLCRNPGYGFDAQYLGFKAEGAKVEFLSGMGTWDTFYGATYQYHRMTAANGKKYFSFRLQWPYSKKHYLKLWLGWHYSNQGTPYHMTKFDFHPFKRTK